MINRNVLYFTVISLAVALNGCHSQQGQSGQQVDADNAIPRVVAVIDESGSFAKNLPDMAEKLRRFIAANAVDGSAEVYVITMDREPKVIGYFNPDKPFGKDGKAVLQQITNPCLKDGTDVGTALKLAHQMLFTKSEYPIGKRFLIIGSDMDADRGTNPIKRFTGFEEYDWNSMKQVTYTAVLYSSMDNQQKLQGKLDTAGVKGIVKNDVESRSYDLNTVVERETQ